MNKPAARWSGRWGDLPLLARGLVILVLPLLLLVVAGTASILATDRQTASQDSARAAVEASNNASAALASLLNAETGVRGYVASGDSSFLQPYHWAQGSLSGQLRRLGDSPDVPPVQTRALDALSTAEMSLLAGLASRTGPEGARGSTLVPQLLQGKATMDRIRAVVEQIQAHAQTDLASHRASVIRARSNAEAIAIAGLAIGLLGVLAMFLFVGRIVRRINQARANAHRLGVGEALVPLTNSRDEIGRLSRELVHASSLLAARTGDLVHAHRAASVSVKDKDEHLSHLGHELRTPLTAILGFGQLLESSGDLAPDDAYNAAQIMHAARHLLAMSDDVRSLGRERVPLAVEVSSIGLAEIAADVCRLMTPIAADRDVRLILAATASIRVRGNRQRLSQVLINLVSNAIKYNHARGQVRVACRQMSPGQARLLVSDTGTGIRAELQPRVFAPYERLEAESTEIEGTGIGLALSRTYIEGMGGSIGLESTEGHGATFWIDLPLAHSAENSEAGLSAASR